MDIIDTAAEIEELQRNAALSAHRIDRNAVSAEHCEECDEPIPEPRRAAVPGCQTCAECQSVIELKNKQRGCSERARNDFQRRDGARHPRRQKTQTRRIMKVQPSDGFHPTHNGYDLDLNAHWYTRRDR